MVKHLSAGGVYCITCSANGKCYVGGAKSVSKRWYDHKAMLVRGIHQCRELQADWNKYGKDAFSVSMLELCGDKRARAVLEAKWIAEKRACDPLFGYNQSPTGGGRPKQPAGTQLDWILRVRLKSGLKAVAQQLAMKNGCGTDVGKWARFVLGREIEKELNAPSPAPRTDDLGF